ncbi:MAG TPA: c-type cytochrome [Gemmatimonadales bacterium]|nr:c-type cytochrome [Gemmatimonadales bacterium]
MLARLGLAAIGAAGCVGAGRAALATRRVLGGDPAHGRRLVADGAYGCTACHTIPGIRAPRGDVGPPLAGLARRPFIAGALPNTPDVLVAFLQDPPARVPQTGMPDVGLGAAQARDIAAYLYTLGSPAGR